MIEIYSKDNCKYCQMAKSVFGIRGLTYTEIDLGVEGEKEKMMERFAKMGLPLPRSVPQIFIAGDHVGGYDDFMIKFP